jgi:hypothetical protein
VTIAAWLARLGGRLLHEDHYTLFVAPALADLEYERSFASDAGARRAWLLVQAHAGLCLAIVGALRFQAGVHAHALLADEARLVALRYDALMIGGILLVQAVYYTGLVILFLDFQD